MLVPAVLSGSLSTLFAAMTDGTPGQFENGVLNAIKAYIATGQVATVDIGTIAAGVFTGAGSGTIIVDVDDGIDILEDATADMETNMALAEGISDAVDAMIENASISVTVTGTATPPGGAPVPVSGSSDGEAIGQKTVLKTALYAIFEAMNDMTTGGDAYMANNMAIAITTYLTTLAITTTGQGVLSGATGTGGFA